MLLKTLYVFIVLTLTGFSTIASDNPAAQAAWNKLATILAEIQAPQFPDTVFNILDFGAVNDSTIKSTEAINSAIFTCSQAGGGTVIVPVGVYLTGAIHLRTNVNLHLSADAVLRFSREEKDYLPLVFTRWEGTECYNYSPFIYAYGHNNIAITGTGTLDGNAGSDHWWSWTNNSRSWLLFIKNKSKQLKASSLLRQMGQEGIPVEQRRFGPGHFLRPNFIQFYHCSNILVEGITIINSPMWVIHPVLSDNVTISHVTIVSPGPNNDGCNPESCTNVLIENSYFSTGNDCIAIKSGRNADGRRIAKPSENIIIRSCTMHHGYGGVVIGSEVSGDVRNVFVEDCVMDSPQLGRMLRIKSNSVRGGIIENVFVRNIQVGQIKLAILHIDFDYKEGDTGNFPPVVRNIHLDNITSQESERAIIINTYKRSPASNINISNSSFKRVKRKNRINYVNGLTLENVFINGVPMDK